MNQEYIEYGLIVAAVVLIIYNIIMVFYNSTSLFKYTKNTINIEVFCVKLTGINLLQSSSSNAQLRGGYSYATNNEINQALSNGMRIQGVANGDIALYLTPDYYTASASPSSYDTHFGDFSTNIPVNFPNINSSNNVSATYWVFIKGYKPDILYSGNANMIFVANQNIQNYIAIQPWNQSQWNSDAPKTLGNNEVFLVDINPFPTTLDYINQALNPGYSLANIDQILWSISRGLSYQSCQNPTYLNQNEDGLILNPIFPGIQIPPTTPCNTSRTLAVWGVKPMSAKTSFSNFANTTILNFNNQKFSLYD